MYKCLGKLSIIFVNNILLSMIYTYPSIKGPVGICGTIEYQLCIDEIQKEKYDLNELIYYGPCCGISLKIKANGEFNYYREEKNKKTMIVCPDLDLDVMKVEYHGYVKCKFIKEIKAVYNAIELTKRNVFKGAQPKRQTGYPILNIYIRNSNNEDVAGYEDTPMNYSVYFAMKHIFRKIGISMLYDKTMKIIESKNKQERNKK